MQPNMQGRIRTYDVIPLEPDAFDHSATRMWVAVIFNETPKWKLLVSKSGLPDSNR